VTTNEGLMATDAAANLIRRGCFLAIAGDEQALRQLPAGNWIGGTIPYFMAEDGGRTTRELVFVSPIDVGEAAQISRDAPLIRFYTTETLPQLCRNAPEHGYSLIIVPGFSEVHSSFAQNAPNYEDMYLKPLIGWIAGVHLDDLGKITPKVVNGQTGQFSDEMAIVIDVALPAEKFAHIDIVNLFAQGGGDTISFPEAGFSATRCLINGVPANFADYLGACAADIRLPLVADYSGALVNVSIKGIVDDEKDSEKRVDFYAPVFPRLNYRLAAPLGDYVSAFQGALPHGEARIAFSCNCILNYLHCELEGKRMESVTGPMTFGEIAYQLLNQTLVYLRIDG
jgi:hypothetical protein